MDIEKVYNINFNGESRLLREKNSESIDYTDKDVKNLCDLSESYNFFKNSDVNDELYDEIDKNKAENTYNEIMGIYEEKSENFNNEKNEYSIVEKSDFSLDEKSENYLIEKNEYSFTEKNDYSLDELNKKRSTTSYPLYEENLLKTNIDLEENIFNDMGMNTYNENYTNINEQSKTVPLQSSKYIQRTKYNEENNIKNKKEISEEKVKYIYKTYTAAPISQTEKTGLWLIDTINELLDKLCDINKKDYYLNNLDVVQEYPIDDVLYTKLNENIKVKWPDYLKLSNIIYYNHILNIYEGMYKRLIKDEQKNIVQNKEFMKRSNTIPLPKFPYKDLKDRCISKCYKNLPELKVINEESEMLEYNNNDDAILKFFFENLVDQIKNKYNEFCDDIGEKLEKIEKKNYSFKEYFLEVSKVFASNILDIISISKFPVMLNSIIESFHSCLKLQNEEEIEDVVFNSSSNIQRNNKMETIYSLPLDSCNTTFNLNRTIQLNNIQNKTTPLYLDKEDKNLLFTSPQKRYNYTSNFSALPKYTKTYANSRSKLSNCFRTDDISKYKETKHNAYINADMLYNNKMNYFSTKNKNMNRNIHGCESENEKENDKYSEKDSNISTNVVSGPYKIVNANNYYTVNSLPLDESIKLENSMFNKRSQVESSEFLECKSNYTPNY